VHYSELQASICRTCWSTRYHTDANVTADAGAPWRLLLTDQHFSNCAVPKDHGHLDAVGVWPQAGNDKIRLIEIKAAPEKGSNLQQKFDRTGRAVLDVLSGSCELVAELHVARLAKLSLPYRFAPKIKGRKVPVTLMVDGRPA
jgi:hypothetical protein